MKKDLPLLQGERLHVRLADTADVPAILHFYHANRVFFAPFDPIRPAKFYTESFWRKRVDLDRREFADDRSLRLFLFANEQPGEVIGLANFTSIIRGVFHACNLGYSLDADRQGHGLMTEALRLGIDHVFGPMNLHRIQANYMPFNIRSGNVLERLGFVREGVARQYLCIAGEWQDHVLTSLTNPKWVESQA